MSFDAAGIRSFLLLVAGLLVIVAAIFIIAKSRSGEVRESLSVFFIIIVAAVVIAIGANLEAIGTFFWNMLF